MDYLKFLGAMVMVFGMLSTMIGWMNALGTA
jgi:hypothetical protein